MGDTQPSQRAVKPDEKVTAELPAMSDRAMLEDLYRISRGTAEQVRIIRTDQDLLMGNVESLKVDVRELQRWKLDSEDRMSRNSERVRAPSEHDLAAQKALADERAAREALARDVAETKAMLAANTEATEAIKKAVVGITTNPKVRTFAKAIFYLVVSAAAARGWLLK